MSVARIIEISSSSEKSFEDAIVQGIARAGKTLRDIRSAWVKEQEVSVKAWRQKYGSGPIGAFDEDEVFRDIQLVEGRIANPAVLAENWPVTPTAAPGTAIGTSARTTPAAVGTTGGFFDRNRDIAVVRIDGADRSPAVVSLINERFDRWRVDIPDTIDTDALINNLHQRLEAARAGSVTWPLDRNAAHRHLANEIFLALYGVAAAR